MRCLQSTNGVVMSWGMQPMDEFGMRHPGKREAIIAAGIAALLVIVAWAASAFTGGSGEPPAAKPDSSENAGELVIDVPGEITSSRLPTACQRVRAPLRSRSPISSSNRPWQGPLPRCCCEPATAS